MTEPFKSHGAFCGAVNRTPIKANFIILGLAALMLGVRVPAQDVQLSAEVDAFEVLEGESLVYTVTASSSGGATPPAPTLPDFSPFQVVGRGIPSTQQSFQWINGQSSSSITVTQQVRLRATRPGVFQIPPATVRVNGRTISSNSVQVVVYALDQAQSRQDAAARYPEPRSNNPNFARALRGKVFVRAEVSNAAPFVREPVIVSWYLYYLDGAPLDGAGVQEEPQFEQALAENLMPTQGSLSSERVDFDGRRWNRALLRKYRVVPLTAGSALLGPITVQLQKRTMDFFLSTETASVESLPLKMEVKPLPEPAPAEFTGTVGAVTISGPETDRRQLTTDDVVVWRVQLDGPIPAELIQPPRVPETLEDFDVFKAQFVDAAGQPARPRTFEWTLRPKRAGDLEIPSLVYGYFNPESGRYESITLGAVPLKVTPGSIKQPLVVAQNAAAGPEGAAPGGSRIVEVGQALRYIKPAAPGVLVRAEALETRGLPDASVIWALVLLPPAAVLGTWGWSRRRAWLAEHQDEARRRAAHGVARRQLKAARSLLAGGDKNADAFYAEVARAIRAFIGARLNVAPAGLTLDEVRRLLEEAGCQDDVCEVVCRLLERCDAARYAPGASTGVQMQATLEAAMSALDALFLALKNR
ncbi:MAG: BatD family protein [Candidatus Sumerlaeia bacterium]